MKNFFWVINKEKIYAYVVSIMTIVTLFFMSTMINKDLSVTETSSNMVNVNEQNINNTMQNEDNVIY